MTSVVRYAVRTTSELSVTVTIGSNVRYKPSSSDRTMIDIPCNRSTNDEDTCPVPRSSHCRSSFNVYNLTRRLVFAMAVRNYRVDEQRGLKRLQHEQFVSNLILQCVRHAVTLLLHWASQNIWGPPLKMQGRLSPQPTCAPLLTLARKPIFVWRTAKAKLCFVCLLLFFPAQ